MIRHRTGFILSTLVVGRLPFTNDTASNRFHSFHFGRRQATKYYNVLSNFISLFSGVPQDSILRPSLFTLCISDVLNKKSRGCVVASAEDLTLMCDGDTPADAALWAKNAINLVFKWATNHDFILNAQKCETLFTSHFTRKSH